MSANNYVKAARYGDGGKQVDSVCIPFDDRDEQATRIAALFGEAAAVKGGVLSVHRFLPSFPTLPVIGIGGGFK